MKRKIMTNLEKSKRPSIEFHGWVWSKGRACRIAKTLGNQRVLKKPEKDGKSKVKVMDNNLNNSQN